MTFTSRVNEIEECISAVDSDGFLLSIQKATTFELNQDQKQKILSVVPPMPCLYAPNKLHVIGGLGKILGLSENHLDSDFQNVGSNESMDIYGEFRHL